MFCILQLSKEPARVPMAPTRLSPSIFHQRRDLEKKTPEKPASPSAIAPIPPAPRQCRRREAADLSPAYRSASVLWQFAIKRLSCSNPCQFRHDQWHQVDEVKQGKVATGVKIGKSGGARMEYATHPSKRRMAQIMTALLASFAWIFVGIDTKCLFTMTLKKM